MKDCSNSSALAMELLQSCTKASIWKISLKKMRLKMLSVICLPFCLGDNGLMMNELYEYLLYREKMSGMYFEIISV